eukprot:g3809.t1
MCVRTCTNIYRHQILLLLVVFSILGCFIFQCSGDDGIGSDVTVVIDRAIRKLSSANFDDAFDILKTFSAKRISKELNAEEESELFFFMGTAKHGGGEREIAMDYYKKALVLRPDMPGGWKNLAILTKEMKKYDIAEAAYRRALELDPESTTSMNSLGYILNNGHRYLEALTVLREALRSFERQGGGAEDVPDPNELYADMSFNLGVAAMNTGNVQEALHAYYEVVRTDPKHAASLVNLASLYHKSGQMGQAIEFYNSALDAVASGPRWANAGIQEMTYLNLGHALAYDGHSKDALVAFTASRRSHRLRKSLGFSIDEDGHATASDSFDEFEVSILAHEVRTRRTVCDWSRDRTDLRTLINEVHRGIRSNHHSPALLPFDTLILAVSPAYQHDVAVAWSSQYLSLPRLPTKTLRLNKRVRVGFLSYDFNDHPTAHMIEGVFKENEHHAAATIKRHVTDLVAISFGKEDGSVFRRAIRDACTGKSRATRKYAETVSSYERPCSGFLNIAALSHGEAAEAIAGANIDILLDLQAHTLGGRQEILARRPAPVQVSFLVYPGTMGSEWIGYLVADRFVAPPELAAHYTESLVYLPDSYQINYYPLRDLPRRLRGDDDNENEAEGRITAETLEQNEAWLERFKALPASLVLDDGTLPRSAHALPPDADEENFVVFCNFNKIQKFDRTSFSLWLSILRRVPRSVLWLLQPSTRHEVLTVRANLMAEALSMGVLPSRIVWAPRVPKMAHLSRHKHATLFLDTLVYNAHSTASDALRGGLPVITCPKEPFAGRVAAALLRAVHMPELVVSSVREYEDLAVRLARSPHLVRNLRNRLLAGGSKMPLFDSSQYRQNFERAMSGIWDVEHAGKGLEGRRSRMSIVVAPRSTSL